MFPIFIHEWYKWEMQGSYENTISKNYDHNAIIMAMAKEKIEQVQQKTTKNCKNYHNTCISMHFANVG